MSIDYSFYVSTNLSPESVMRTLILSLGVGPNPEDECNVGTPNFNAIAGRVRGRSREISLERFEFQPEVHIVFRTWPHLNSEAKAEIVRGTLAICRAIPGDAILLYNGEIVLFMRKAGELSVNSAYWRGDYSLFPMPYEVKTFPLM
jgi:hypothetical protein